MSNSNGIAPNDTEDASIDPLEIRIGRKLKQLVPLSASCCIYKVPERLRSLNPSVYTPKVVSIGPLHHGTETLQDMEEHKYRYLQQFLASTRENLEYYIQKIRSQEEKLRNYYAKIDKFESDDFVTIILVDSAFIIVLLLNCYFNVVYPADRIFKAPKLIRDIKPDLLLLENQLPFFILEDLFNPNKVDFNFYRGNPVANKNLSFVQLFLKFFGDELDEIGVDYKLETQKLEKEKLETEISSKVKEKHFHFLDIIRNFCLPQERGVEGVIVIKKGKRDPTKPGAPSITELHQAGVELRRRSTRNLFDIQFNNGILEIPKLTVSNRMQHMLRNLAAFEQCHYWHKSLADYFDLLDCFVNTSKDVELLAEKEIVINTLGDSSEACSLINSLSKEIFWSGEDFYFATLYEELHNHCNEPLNKWKAILWQNYLNTPWAIVSVVAAAFLIILTVIQTVCSLISL